MDVIPPSKRLPVTRPPAMGDAVRYRSGGPAMLVVDVLTNGRLVCAWLAIDKKPMEGVYTAQSVYVIRKGGYLVKKA